MVRHSGKQFGVFLIELYIHLPYDPGIPLLGFYPRETKACVYTKTSMRMLKAALFKIAIDWKLLKCPSVGSG